MPPRAKSLKRLTAAGNESSPLASVQISSKLSAKLQGALFLLLSNHFVISGESKRSRATRSTCVGLDDDQLGAFVSRKFSDLGPILVAVEDSRLPLQLAHQLTKTSLLPRHMFLARALPFRVTVPHLVRFDSRLRNSLATRLSLPNQLLLRHFSPTLSRLEMVGGAFVLWLSQLLPPSGLRRPR